MPPSPSDSGERNVLETYTDSDAGLRPPDTVPVLIVLGDARTLGKSRSVLRIDGSLEIGRMPSAPIHRSWAIDDDRASRRHATIEADVAEGTARIVDHGSRNGTTVDGRELRGESAPLSPGSLVFVGGHAAVFRFALEAELQAITQDLLDPFTPVATTSPELARKSRVLRVLAKGGDD